MTLFFDERIVDEVCSQPKSNIGPVVYVLFVGKEADVLNFLLGGLQLFFMVLDTPGFKPLCFGFCSGGLEFLVRPLKSTAVIVGPSVHNRELSLYGCS